MRNRIYICIGGRDWLTQRCWRRVSNICMYWRKGPN